MGSIDEDLRELVRETVRDEIRRAIPKIADEVARRLEATLALPAAPVPLRLSATEAAVQTGRHPETIREAMRFGDLHATQRGRNGRWQVRRDCLDAWADGTLCKHQEAQKAARRRPKK